MAVAVKGEHTAVVRVMFFVETPHRLAGSQRSLLAALTRIENHGIQPQVIFPGPGPVVDAYRDAGVLTRIHEAPPSMLLFNKKLLALGRREKVKVLVRDQVPYVRSLARLVVDEGFSAMHFNTPRGIVMAGGAAKLARRPCVLHLRGAPLGFGRGYWTAAQLLADRIVLVAGALLETIARPFRDRCKVVYNGVIEQPHRDRRAARAALATRIGQPALAESDETLFVCLSSFTPFKGIHHLLTSAAQVRARGVRARYVLAGGGGDSDYERFVLARRDALGLADIVHILGFVPDPMAVLSAADVAVLPSVEREQLVIGGTTLDVHGTEGLPRSILEALSLGVPVVASRVQGVVEQLEDGVTGRIIPPSDPSALADALVSVAADPEWRQRAGSNARDVARSKFTVDAAAAGLAEVLRSLGAPR